MADTKISALTDGVTAIGTDRLPVSRAGVNFYITPGYISTLLGFSAGGILAAAKGGAGTITGALKGSGAGVVSQAAASDLSNGATGSGAVALATGAALTSPTLTTPITTSYTFATLPSAAANSGASARVTDIGPATAGSLWISNGTIWKPVGGRVVIVPAAASFTAASGTGEKKSNLAFQFPAAFFNAGDHIRCVFTLAKAGAVGIGTVLVRMGTAGTVAGDTIVYPSWSLLNAAGRTAGAAVEFVIIDATHTQMCGPTPATNGGGIYAGSNSTVVAANVAITNVSNSLWVEVCITGVSDDLTMPDGYMEYQSA